MLICKAKWQKSTPSTPTLACMDCLSELLMKILKGLKMALSGNVFVSSQSDSHRIWGSSLYLYFGSDHISVDPLYLNDLVVYFQSTEQTAMGRLSWFAVLYPGPVSPEE